MHSNDGRLESGTVVRFQRLLPGPIERAWRFLTESEHLAGWLGPGSTIEPRAGGAVSIAEGHIRGVVTQWQPPRLLAYTWNVFGPRATESPYPESYVTFELREEEGGVLLTLTHLPIIEGFEAQTLMGWHTLLDLLDALVHSREPEPREALLERHRVRYGVESIKQ
ncbi:MAG TPA: SRPBCC family protein [Dehalococcoidia bacterium]